MRVGQRHNIESRSLVLYAYVRIGRSCTSEGMTLRKASVVNSKAAVVPEARVLAAGTHVSLDHEGCMVVEDGCLLERPLQPHEAEPLQGVEVQAVGG